MKKWNLFIHKPLLLAVFALSAGIIWSGCSKSFINDNDNPEAAGLMAFHLTADRSAISIRLSGETLTNTPLSYNSFTGAYLAIFPGNRTVESYDMNGLLASSPAYSFAPGKYYSLFVAGANGSYQNIITEDVFDNLSASSGQAYIRYINAIPDSAKPNMVVTAGGTTVITDQPHFATVSVFTGVTPGEISIELNNGSTIDVSRTITVENKKVYTILLTGIPGSAQTPVEIKYITNGTLNEDPDARMTGDGVAKNTN